MRYLKIDRFSIRHYNISKLTREGLRLGSRMGVGVITKNSFAPGVDLFF